VAADAAADEIGARTAALLAAVDRAAYRADQAGIARSQADEHHRVVVAAHAALVDRARRSRERAEARRAWRTSNRTSPTSASSARPPMPERPKRCVRPEAADRAVRDLDDATAAERRAREAWVAGRGRGR
jgi:exonuclease SbcC